MVQNKPREVIEIVFQFRPYKNSDPPHLVEIWNAQPAQRGLAQPMTTGLLEMFLFSKPYFDPDGLIVVTKENKPVGFIHAGFGSNEAGDGLSTEMGVTHVIMLNREHHNLSLGLELLKRSEDYQRSKGAVVFYAGGILPLNSFYLGLYGGSELPGVLETDFFFQEVIGAASYHEIDRVAIMQRELASFRPLVSRIQRSLKREVEVRVIDNPTPSTWWEAYSLGTIDCTRYELVQICNDQVVATVGFWDVEPLSNSWGLQTAGMHNLEVSKTCRRGGYATYLLTEAFKDLREKGIVLVEAQTMQQNSPAICLYDKLGFTPLEQGIIFRKDSANHPHVG